jgi:L-rhamnose mutarotase
MQRVGFVIKIRPDKIEEYKAHHKAVWPDMQAALQRSGYHRYSLFLRPDGLVFGYFEPPQNVATAREAMSREEVNTRWQASMAPLREAFDGEFEGISLIDLEEVFHID